MTIVGRSRAIAYLRFIAHLDTRETIRVRSAMNDNAPAYALNTVGPILIGRAIIKGRISPGDNTDTGIIRRGAIRIPIVRRSATNQAGPSASVNAKRERVRACIKISRAICQ